eukprot:TRINITY_DN590_c0_g1_i8.p1 TRINITY_DN590_c0_g1~~TRINITY_DN590_c0_g1_i8.p1  ORF type:complete len:188 (+),score=43.49 TRINITY_DN590_c0_g1_i8:270-833(+)
MPAKQVFASYDNDDSGAISYKEFRKGFASLESGTGRGAGKEKDLKCFVSIEASLFAQMDGDTDGQLSFRELLMAAYPGCSPDDIDRYIGKYGCQKHCEKGHVHRAPMKRLTEEEQEELEGILRVLDSNGDGVIERKEFVMFCSNVGIDDETIDEWFEQYDTDNSGTLDPAEFKECFREIWGGGFKLV